MNSNDIVNHAMNCLMQSIGSILRADLSEENQAEEIATSLMQCESYLSRNGCIAPIAKSKGPVERRDRAYRRLAREIAKAARRSGPHGLAAALLDHLHDRLERHRERHGYEGNTGESDMEETVEKLEAERLEKLLEIGKREGAVVLAKMLLKDGNEHGLSEEDYTAILVEHAKRRYPDKPADIAFAAVFEDTSADGVALRKAHELTKAFPYRLAPMDMEPRVVTGNSAQAVDNPKSALDQLNELTAEQHKRSPEIPYDQVFATVYAANPELAQLEREQNRPRPIVYGQ